MADKILPPSVLLAPGDQVEVLISGQTPLIYGPSITEIREAIDAADIGVATFSGDELAIKGALGLLNWYEVKIEVERHQSSGELAAKVANAVDSQLVSIWDVQVAEVREPGTSVGDVLGDLIPTVPTGTAASLVAIAVLVVVVLVAID